MIDHHTTFPKLTFLNLKKKRFHSQREKVSIIWAPPPQIELTSLRIISLESASKSISLETPRTREQP